MKTAIQKVFAPFKGVLPDFLWRPLRALATAVMTPAVFSLWSGHFKSSLREKAVARSGKPLPWYTYPCIQMLQHRDFTGKRVLEFGGGQSTLWWASVAERVVTFEGDPQWHAQLVKLIPANVTLHLAPCANKEAFLAKVKSVLDTETGARFDIAVIDADFREELVEFVWGYLADRGAVICDDAESYGFYEATRHSSFQRVDFLGHSPGVILPHCTSVYFKDRCFLFDAKHRIPDVAVERE